MTSFQKIVIAISLTAVIGAELYAVKQMHNARIELQTLQQRQTLLVGQVQQLQVERDKATNQLAGLAAENSRLKANPHQNESLKLRGELGALHQQMQDTNSAKRKLNQPPLASAQEYLDRAQTNYSNGLYDAQFDDLTRAIELNPNSPEAYRERAMLYKQISTEKYSATQVVADLTHVLDAKPDDSFALERRAQAYREMGQGDKAIADLTTYIEGDLDYSRSGNKDIAIANALIKRGQLYLDADAPNYSEVIADCTKAIQMFPQVQQAYRLRGWSYEKLGDTEKARQDYAVEPK